ncbi:MAG: SDR family oxidoreductase [Sphingomonadaceae bacterium]|nr:SDR family oxidoreductase [Sphingomonadaceae bacterium]
MLGKQKAEGVAVVTGAGRGIGAACARALVEDGWTDLLLCDINGDAVKEVAQQLHNSGVRIETIAGDVTTTQFTDELVATLGDRPVAAALHAAGVAPATAETARLLEINLDSTISFVETIKPRMADGGAAVVIASNTSYFPAPPELLEIFEQPMPPEGSAAFADQVSDSFLAYLLSKRGVRALAKREAVSFGKKGARIVSVSPGLIDTVMTADRESDTIRMMIEGAAIKRVADTAELAAVVAFLLSPKASFMTGCDVLVDGGEVAGLGYF